MMTSFRACIVLIAVWLMPQILAPQPAAAWNLGMKVGGYFPESNEGLMNDAETGLGTEISVIHFFGENVAAELGGGRYQTRVPVYTSFGSRIKTIFKVSPITLSLKIGPRNNKFFPYLEAGYGVYYSQIEKIFDSESDSASGPHVGIGMYFRDFGLEARYFSSTVRLLNSDVKIDGILLTINMVIGLLQ